MTARTLTSAHTNTSSGMTATMTFDAGFICDVQFTSLVADCAEADTYTLSIDGTTVASCVVAVGGGTNTLVLTPAAPIMLSAGVHTFQISGTAARHWYHNSLPTTSGDNTFGVIGAWRESTNNGPHVNINFNEATTLSGAGAVLNNVSSSNYAGQSFSLSLSSAIYLYRWLDVIRLAESYSFWIDDKFVGGIKTTVTGQVAMFQPSSPMYLAAGAHTVNLRPFTSKTAYYRTPSATIGGAIISSWGTWTEQGGTVWPAGLFAYDASGASPPAGDASGVVGFL